MITNINVINYTPYIFEKNNCFEKKSSFYDKFKQISSSCEYAWSYAGKIVLITRHFLTAASRDVQIADFFGRSFTKSLTDSVIRLKLLAIVSVPFSIKDYFETVKNIFKCFYLQDAEGVALNSLSITIILADVVDSITTFLNATSTLIVGSGIEAFASIGLPLGFTISGMGTISRIIHVTKSVGLFNRIDEQIKNKNLNKDSLKIFLESTLGIGDELKILLAIPKDQLSEEQKKEITKIKEKSKAAIRSATLDAFNDLKALLVFIEKRDDNSFSLEDRRYIEKILKKIENRLLRKVKTHIVGILANLFSLAALSLFAVGIVSPAPFFFLSIAFAIRFFAVMYQNNKL
jgi:hypothetical protein